MLSVAGRTRSPKSLTNSFRSGWRPLKRKIDICNSDGYYITDDRTTFLKKHDAGRASDARENVPWCSFFGCGVGEIEIFTTLSVTRCVFDDTWNGSDGERVHCSFLKTIALQSCFCHNHVNHLQLCL